MSWRGDATPTYPGATFRCWNRRGAAVWSSLCRIDDVVSGHKLTFTVTSGRRYTRWTWAVTPGYPPGLTIITLSWEMLHDVPAAVLACERPQMMVNDRRASLQGSIEAALARVKGVLESPPSPSPRGRLRQALASAATAFGLDVASRVDPRLMRMTRGRLRLMPVRVLVLHTVGARTGRRRDTALAYVTDGDGFVIFASNGGRPRMPGWYYNLQRDPCVEVSLRGKRIAMGAHDVPAEDWDRVWAKVTAWQPELERFRRRLQGVRPIPLVRLMPR